MPTNVTDATFQSQVIEASKSKPVLLDLWAPWCGPCRALAPILEEIEQEFSDKITIVKLDTDDNVKTASTYNITSIPTLLVFVNGEVVKTMIGAKPKQGLLTDLSPWLN